MAVGLEEMAERHAQQTLTPSLTLVVRGVDSVGVALRCFM